MRAPTVLSEYPRLNWGQRILRRLVGAQDLVAVIATQHFPDGRTVTNTFWMNGVDVRCPLAPEDETGVLLQIEKLPLTGADT